MARINSKDTLIQYCLRQLGEPVITVNISDDQIDDDFDTALQFYQEFHSDAIIKRFRKHQITQTDMDNEYITLPDSLLFVSRVLPFYSNSTNRSEFSLNYQLALNTVSDLFQMTDLVTYEMTRQHMNIIDQTFNGMDQLVRFSRHMNRLYIETAWGQTFKVGQYIIIEGYETLNPEEYTDVYNDLYLKKYLTALLKRHWAQNLGKFEGVQLPGGVTISASAMKEEAKQEIKDLEEEMESKWEMPPMFFVG
jgi:hypothetical protein